MAENSLEAIQALNSVRRLTFNFILLDHVGMALKFDSEPDEIFLLEATSNLGVHLKRFSNVVPHLGAFY